MSKGFKQHIEEQTHRPSVLLVGRRERVHRIHHAVELDLGRDRARVVHHGAAVVGRRRVGADRVGARFGRAAGRRPVESFARARLLPILANLQTNNAAR